MKTALALALGWCIVAGTAASAAPAGTLDIYFIDVEGGQSTLVVTPGKETLLIDTGWPGDGSAQSKAGEAAGARDAQRIAAAARDAGVKKIDYLLITHLHRDHVGGVPELAQLLPIGTFVDYGGPSQGSERESPDTMEVFAAYEKVRAHGRHIEPRPGERLQLRGVETVIVSADGSALKTPLPGAGAQNHACDTAAREAGEKNENPRSNGVVMQYGKFRFMSLGDLTGQALFDLACPVDRIGPIDAYVVAHHGGADAADPALFAAFKPRVAILNNGARKGSSAEMMASLRQSPQIEDVWQLHRSENEGVDSVAPERIANLDERTAHWLKLSARADGSFSVVNGRTGQRKDYGAR